MIVGAPDLSRIHGWALSQALMLKLLPQQQLIGGYPVPKTSAEGQNMRDMLVDKGGENVLGFMEAYTCVYLYPGAKTCPKGCVYSTLVQGCTAELGIMYYRVAVSQQSTVVV